MKITIEPLGYIEAPIVPAVRSRFVDTATGLRMHLLEAGTPGDARAHRRWAQERHLPNRRLLIEGYRTIRRIERDVPVDVELPLGDRRDFAAAKEAAYRAAIVSRYVSPTQTPEVYIEFADVGVHLRVRAYVAASDLIEAFRSELVELWLERSGPPGEASGGGKL